MRGNNYLINTRMLWGAIVSEQKVYALPAESEYDLLHISNAALSRSSEPGKTYLMITKGKETYTLAVLQKDKNETASFDIYVRASQNIKLSVSGKGEIHVTGYFEPTEEGAEGEDAFLEGNLMEEDSEDEEIPEENEEDEESEEEKQVKKAEPKKKDEKKHPEEKKDIKKPEQKKEQKKDEGKKHEAGKKPEPKKQPEKPKAEQIGGKKVEAEDEEDSEDAEGFDPDLLGESGEEEDDSEEEPDKLKKIVAEKKHAAEKPLAPPQPKKVKEEKTEVGGQAPKPAQGEGKKKKKNKHKNKEGNKPNPQ